MVPFYIVILPLESYEIIQKYSTNIFVIILSISSITIIVEYMIYNALQGENMPLEYPLYNLWKPLIIWNILVWFSIVITILYTKNCEYNVCIQHKYSMRGSISSILLIIIGLSPFFGARNHPALGMYIMYV